MMLTAVTHYSFLKMFYSIVSSQLEPKIEKPKENLTQTELPL